MSNTQTQCRRCHHPLRPKDTKAADHPGTKQNYVAGFCPGCFRKISHGTALHGPKYPDWCMDCGRSLKRRECTKGRCHSCYMRRLREKHERLGTPLRRTPRKKPAQAPNKSWVPPEKGRTTHPLPEKSTLEPQARRDRDSLDAYLAARNNRLKKQRTQ